MRPQWPGAWNAVAEFALRVICSTTLVARSANGRVAFGSCRPDFETENYIEELFSLLELPPRMEAIPDSHGPE